MASSANGNVKITTEIETAGLQESLNRLESIFNGFATNLKETARKTGEDVNNSLSETSKASKTLQTLGDTAKKVGSELKKVGVAAVGLAGSFAGIVKGAISTADRVDELSKRLGMSVESLSRLDYVASQSGTSIEAFGTSMRMIAQNINTGSDAYEQLGVDVRKATGELKTQEEILLETIRALQKMPNGTQKSAMALKALGRNSQQLNEVLSMTSDEFEALMKRSDELGLTLDTKTTTAAQKIADKFTDLKSTFKMALVNAVTPMIPALETLTDKFIAMLQPGGELAEAFKSIAKAGLYLVENVLPPLINGLAWVVKHGPEVIGVFAAIKASLQALSGNWIGAIITGITGLFGSAVLHDATKVEATVEETTDALRDMGVEVNNLKSPVIEVSGNLQEMTAKLESAQKELAELEKELALLPFDETITNTQELADKQDELKTKIATVHTEIEKYTKAIDDVKKRQNELNKSTDNVNETVEKELKTFIEWTNKVESAEAALKDFIATNTEAGQKFDAGLLSDEKLAEFNKLKKELDDARIALDSLEKAMTTTNEVAKKTDAFEKWTTALDLAQEELKKFVATQADLQGGLFDEKLLGTEDLAKFQELKAKVTLARESLERLKNTLVDVKEETSEVSEEIEVAKDAFADFTNEVDRAETALKVFIAEHSKLGEGFKVENLSETDLAIYQALKADAEQARKALDSMNDAMRDTKQEVQEVKQVVNETSDPFAKWTQAVYEAEKALKEFIATSAESKGSFDIETLSDDERARFEKLLDTLRQAKSELQKLQESTDTTIKETESSLINVADTIASAWGQVGLAFGNGIESTIQTIASGAHDLRSVASELTGAIADTLSAIGDALIQAGIAKQVAQNLESVSPAYAIAMGLAIKAAAGAIKGLLAKISRDAGSFASGGIVGGSSYNGDRMSANVNSGEMIINRQQQAALWDFIKGGSKGGSNSPNIEIVNYAGVDISAEQAPDGRTIKIMVERFASNMLRGAKGSKLMGQTYGIRQLGRH